MYERRKKLYSKLSDHVSRVGIQNTHQEFFTLEGRKYSSFIIAGGKEETIWDRENVDSGK